MFVTHQLGKCANCGKPEPEGTKYNVCARCKQSRYCSRECQVTHWKSQHKKECQAMDGLKLAKPSGPGKFVSTFNFRTLKASPTAREGDGYRKPNHVAVGEKFFVKVQGGGPTMPLLIYDETRQCTFDYTPEMPGFDQLRAVVNAEPAWQGRKTYMQASFDQNGDCTVYPASATLKMW